MKLTDEWFTSLSEDENGNTLIINGRDSLGEFMQSGKYKERIEITWKYEADSKGMPTNETAKLMEAVSDVLKPAMEKKDKLGILTGIYTGTGDRVWVFYVRNVRAFGERLNSTLAEFDLLPLSIYTEFDPDWEEYKDMYEAKQWALE